MKSRGYRIRGAFCLILTALLLMGAIPTGALFAEDAPIILEAEGEAAPVLEETKAENELIFETTVSADAAYLRQPEDSTAARNRLGDVGQRIYDHLTAIFEEIAKGERASTVVTLSADQLAQMGASDRYR